MRRKIQIKGDTVVRTPNGNFEVTVKNERGRLIRLKGMWIRNGGVVRKTVLDNVSPPITLWIRYTVKDEAITRIDIKYDRGSRVVIESDLIDTTGKIVIENGSIVEIISKEDSEYLKVYQVRAEDNVFSGHN